MLPLLLLAQLATATSVDSVYSTPALRQFVAAAAIANQEPPPELSGYQARVETEMSLMVRDTLGREHAAEVEQLAANARWARGGIYEVHVVGYRSQSIGVPYSILSIVRAWTVPSLYGNRLSLGASFADRRRANDSLIAVHPFAVDRDQFYTFSGGDTITVLHAGSRSIPIVRIRVHPHFRGPTKLGAFDGEIDVDATRHQIILMRGQFVILGGSPSLRETVLRASGVVAVAYVEFVNAEVDGRYWLPAFQRSEFQAAFPVLTQNRPILRLVSTFSDVRVVDSARAPRDSTLWRRVVVSWAPPDSIASFRGWSEEIGAQTESVHADDFADMAPNAWRADGPPRLNLFPATTSRILRFDRVEGLFTGIAPSVDFRSLAPGLSTGGFVGWAWSERTTRGGAFVTYHPRDWIVSARAERALANTNDFTLPLEEDPGVAAVLGSVDNFDYVDRRSAMLSATRILGSVDEGLVTTQFGLGRDAAEPARLTHGLIPGQAAFRPNRGAANGSYALGSADLELHPNVSGDFVQPGFGARVHYEIGRGDLDWQRMQLSLSARRYLGPVSLAMHADGGLLLGAHPPPQQLFEIGGNQALPGYEYKQFAGDRAALFRGFTSYRFPIWKTPKHVWRNYYIPGVSPGIGASIQGGWTELSSPGAIAAVRALGAPGDTALVSLPTHGVRATFGAGITLFSDILHVGFARPIDHPARWRFVAGFGASF
ncbi:MAG TPA: hypothetical protein VHB25_13080 [Gemmatimonadaceae bacterium]|nr:hypothetical protein [Gemmatimonadaceae bacterium]